MSFTYRGLKATLERHIVTDAEIDQQLDQVRQQNPRTVHVEGRPTQDGDEVVLDYAGFCDGEQFAGGTAQNQTLVLGSGMFIPGFEEQLLDKVPGQEVSVFVTFPEQYHSADLAGKAVVFQDPYQLSRDLEETEEAREIIMSYAVLGEMLLNRAETVWAGNILMAQYMPEIIKKVAERRIFNATSIGATAIVTACVSEYVSLKAAAKDVEIISLEDLILGE